MDPPVLPDKDPSDTNNEVKKTPISESMTEGSNDGSTHSMEDQLSQLPSAADPNTSNVISHILQETLGINEKGKCIRHPTCPVLLFTKDRGMLVKANGIYKIVSCRVCYAEEKSVGIRQGKSFSAVVTQLRNLATQPTSDIIEQGSQNSEVFNLHNSLGSLGDVEPSSDGTNHNSSINGIQNHNFLSNAPSATAVMESIMKRLSQVHNWTIRQKDKEIMSLQLHINSLEQQLASEQDATSEQKTIVKALRRTIQQDLKIIKSMATSQKNREDQDNALLSASMHAKIDNRISAGGLGSPIKTNQAQDDRISPTKQQSLSPKSSTPIRYFSPSKAHSPKYSGSPKQSLSPKQQSGAVGGVVAARKEHPNSLRSMAKQARKLERMQSTRSIEEPIFETHDEENENSKAELLPPMDIIFNKPDNGEIKDDAHDELHDEDLDDNEDDDDDGDDDDDDDEDEKKKRFSTGSYWSEGDMRSLKSSSIFQSFRGGLLDIPKSPPKARHDLDDDELEDGNKRNLKNKRKKLHLKIDLVDALKFPARGVISRTNSSDEGFPTGTNLVALQQQLEQEEQKQKGGNMVLGGGLFLSSISSTNSVNNQVQSHPQTPLTADALLDTPSTTASSVNNIGGGLLNISNLGNNKDISLDTLALKLSQLPLSAMSADETPEQSDTKVQQHPNMPFMSPLEVNGPSVGSITDTEDGSPTKDGYSSPQAKIPGNISLPPRPTSGGKNQSTVPLSTTTKGETQVSKDKKFVFSVTNAVTRDKFGDEGIYTGYILVTEGLPHGKGKMKYESGRIYDGDWICGQWHGRGKLLNPNGDMYTGEFFFDSRHGQGNYKWDNGDIYEGSFVSDKRHGKGKFSFHNGNVYEGEFCDGMFEGQGKYVFEGGYYVGEWKSGRYDGTGELVNATGGKFTGEFRNSVAHGFGTEVTADGRVRRGMWTLGKPSEGFAR